MFQVVFKMLPCYEQFLVINSPMVCSVPWTLHRFYFTYNSLCASFQGFVRNRIRKHLLVFAAAAPIMALVTYFGLSQVIILLGSLSTDVSEPQMATGSLF